MTLFCSKGIVDLNFRPFGEIIVSTNDVISVGSVLNGNISVVRIIFKNTLQFVRYKIIPGLGVPSLMTDRITIAVPSSKILGGHRQIIGLKRQFCTPPITTLIQGF